MATHYKSFDDAYQATCNACDETLEWEWDGDELAFEATCGCMKLHRLTPMSGERDVDEGEDDGYDED